MIEMPKNFADFDSVVITAAFFSSRVRFIIVHCPIVQSPTCQYVSMGLIWSRGVAYSEEKTLRVDPSGSLWAPGLNLKISKVLNFIFPIVWSNWNSKVSGHQLSRTLGPTE